MTAKQLRLCTYNVQSARADCLQQVARTLESTRVDLSVLTETKLQGYHARHAFGFDILATQSTSKFRGGVALLWKAHHPDLHIESEKTHGPNVVSWLTASYAEEYMESQGGMEQV